MHYKCSINGYLRCQSEIERRYQIFVFQTRYKLAYLSLIWFF